MKINCKLSKALAAAFLALSAVSLAESSGGHPGRTDANGCDTDPKTGSYHCHNRWGSGSGSSGSGSDSPSGGGSEGVCLTFNDCMSRGERQLLVTDKQFIDRTYLVQGGSSKVVIYSDHDYRGLSQKLGPGRYDVRQLTIENDSLSSLRVPQGLRVILYEHDGFQGRTKEVTSDTPSVENDFNDITSSIEIQPIP
ncbi:beta/gamma crystallin-related protein [Microcoleus sp. Pol11C1]|uniref:YHYH domain-containing protein n=1 Tax=unclassified Microcoleus TaxID=2642155 RepID=UPI002FD4826B